MAAHIGVSRFGGLRCPSETSCLAWQDMDWERNRFRVDSPKRANGGFRCSRSCGPTWKRLSSWLRKARSIASIAIGTATPTCATTFTKIIKRAGVKVWPKLFHNLRASRETELAATYPIHVVCEWIGNSAAIAAKHYLTVREEDFERAAQGGAKSGAPQRKIRRSNPPHHLA